MAHILVVDDEDQIRTLIREALERKGHAVEEASSGAAAVTMLRKAPVDLMIVDVIMPDKGGIETLIEAHREFAALKTIVMSGRVDTESESWNPSSAESAGYRVRHDLDGNDGV
jgi:DNA-binding response OmpR family regulator